MWWFRALWRVRNVAYLPGSAAKWPGRAPDRPHTPCPEDPSPCPITLKPPHMPHDQTLAPS